MFKDKSLIILIILAIGAIMVGLLIWFIYISDDFLGPVDDLSGSETEQTAPQASADTEKMTERYLTEIKVVMFQYREFIDNQDFKKISELKNTLLSLIVPKTYRDGHAQLVILLERVEQGLTAEEVKLSFEQILAENKWLNEL